jgi:hypothetical protein
MFVFAVIFIYHLRIHVQLRIRFDILLPVHFRVLLVIVTFNKMMSMPMYHFLRWFCPLFNLCDSGAIFRF